MCVLETKHREEEDIRNSGSAKIGEHAGKQERMRRQQEFSRARDSLGRMVESWRQEKGVQNAVKPFVSSQKPPLAKRELATTSI